MTLSLVAWPPTPRRSNASREKKKSTSPTSTSYLPKEQQPSPNWKNNSATPSPGNTCRSCSHATRTRKDTCLPSCPSASPSRPSSSTCFFNIPWCGIWPRTNTDATAPSSKTPTSSPKNHPSNASEKKKKSLLPKNTTSTPTPSPKKHIPPSTNPRLARQTPNNKTFPCRKTFFSFPKLPSSNKMPTAMEQKPKKKKKGCLRYIVLFFVIFIGAVIITNANKPSKEEIAAQKAQAAKVEEQKRIEAEKAKDEAARLEQERLANETPEEREKRLFKAEISKINSIPDLEAKRETYRGKPEDAVKWNVTVDRINELKKQEEEGIKKKLKSHFSLWDGSCGPLEKEIKKHLNDPSSYDHDKTGYKYITAQKVFYVECRFRAKNQFGAKVISYASCHLNPDGTIENFKFREHPIMKF